MCTRPRAGRRTRAGAVKLTPAQRREVELEALKHAIGAEALVVLQSVCDYWPDWAAPLRGGAVAGLAARHPITLGQRLRELADLCDQYEYGAYDGWHGYEDADGRLLPAELLFPHLAAAHRASTGDLDPARCPLCGGERSPVQLADMTGDRETVTVWTCRACCNTLAGARRVLDDHRRAHAAA